MNKFGRGERAPWNDFPAVIRNGDLGDLKNEPEYLEAKEGDLEAALDLVERLITDDTIEQLSELIGDEKPVILPVLAEEATGRNKIPIAFAQEIAERLNLDVETDIIQQEFVGRTDSGADHRLEFNPSFEGEVKQGKKYIVVDDTLTMGGTLASLRGYIENRGGQVVGATVMTAHPGALDMVVKPNMLEAIGVKHGQVMNEFWKENYGYEIDKLTQGEAGHLKAAQSVDSLRERLTKARDEGIKSLAENRDQTTKTSQQPELDVNLAGNRLHNAALSSEREQVAIQDSSSVEQTYQQTLEIYVQAKHTQVERIEDRLELLIEQQQSKLQQTRLNQPGLLSRPSTKAAWNHQQSQQKARIHTLQHRLEEVREVSDSMSLNGSKIDDLAAKKLSNKQPDLAKEWNDMRTAQRKHQEIMRKKEKKQQEVKKKKKEQERQSRALMRGLGINR